MQRLILVRHCDEESWLPAWPRLTDLHAWHELEGERPLTPEGVRRAEDLAQRLAFLKPDGLVTSPLVRAAQTASLVARTTGLEAEPLAALAEVTFGYLRGFEPRTHRGWRKLITRIPAPRAFWPVFMRAMWLFGRTVGVFSPSAVVERSRDLRQVLEQRSENRTLVVVAHGVVLLYLRAALVEDTRHLALKRRHQLRTGEYRILEFQNGGWVETGRGRAE